MVGELARLVQTLLGDPVLRQPRGLRHHRAIVSRPHTRIHPVPLLRGLLLLRDGIIEAFRHSRWPPTPVVGSSVLPVLDLVGKFHAIPTFGYGPVEQLL